MKKKSFISRCYNFIKLKIKALCVKILSPIRRKKLKRKDFCIISNNCWAGDVYRLFNLPYGSPTAGLYFFADEYIKFLSNLKHYLTLPIEQITFDQSKYQKELIDNNHEKVLLARVDDVEIVMLHYHNWQEAKDKWERRAKRVNYDSLLIKFSRQNGCTDEHVERFAQLNYKNKIFFDNKQNSYPFGVYIRGYEKYDQIPDDISKYRKYVNIYKYVNEGIIETKSN